MHETTDAATIIAPLWRRKWLILLVGIVVAGATYVYYKHQPSVYSASTQLDLGSGSEAEQLINGSQGKALSNHALADTATLITSSNIAEAVRARLRAEHVRSAKAKVRAKATAESDFITITAEAPSAREAVSLANGYALVYLQRQHANYQRQVKALIANTRRQLHRIEAGATTAGAAHTRSTRKGSVSTSAASAIDGSAVIQAASLASKISQLESELPISSAQQVNAATLKSAQLASASPKRNALFGFVLGILLAVTAVLLVSRLDRRLRSLGQIEPIFKAQILAALPRVAAPIASRDGQPTPAQELLEPLRGLHSSLQLGDMLERHGHESPRVLLFLSAEAGDGKSTIVADLALVQREAGAKVAVIEADLRTPVQARLLSVSAEQGLAEVLAGAVSFEAVTHRVGSLRGADSGLQHPGGVATVATRPSGSLSLLAGGGAAANPPALLAGAAMRELLRTAAGDFDYVLVDAPSPLQVADAMPLMQEVDGIVIVARLDHTRETSAERLTQLLARSSTAPVLGVVANSVSRADIKRYGFSPAYSERRLRAPLGR